MTFLQLFKWCVLKIRPSNSLPPFFPPHTHVVQQICVYALVPATSFCGKKGELYSSEFSALQLILNLTLWYHFLIWSLTCLIRSTYTEPKKLYYFASCNPRGFLRLYGDMD